MNTPDTKTKILDVAQDLIQRRGINGMSFKDLSEVIGIRRASIHHHYETKEKLLLAVFDRYQDEYLGNINQILSSDRSPKQKLTHYMALFYSALEDDPPQKLCLCGILAAEIDSIGTEAANLVREYCETHVDVLSKILKQGKDSGEFAYGGNTKAMARMIFSMLEGGLIFVRGEWRRKAVQGNDSAGTQAD